MAQDATASRGTLAAGRVVQVIGPVLDVEFPPAELPTIYTALTLEDTSGPTPVPAPIRMSAMRTL